MRLLHTSDLTLHEFQGGAIPPYAILSHTWQGDEFSFKDEANGMLRVPQYSVDEAPVVSLGEEKKNSVLKVTKFCALAKATYGLDFAWVDTCCIDRSSGTELSESINAMFDWYEAASICVVFLSDVLLSFPNASAGQPGNFAESFIGSQDIDAFCKSRWHTRGFTLQELLAPRRVHFYDGAWNFIGDRKTLQEPIQRATGIPQEGLVDPGSFSCAQRMSWASGRNTTRPEDRAYSLMGLFDVNMPLLYGEGFERAFFRLQLQILEETMDETLLAWDRNASVAAGNELLALDPSYFSQCHDIVRKTVIRRSVPYRMTPKGLEIEICGIDSPDSISSKLAILNCKRATSDKTLAIRVEENQRPNTNSVFRVIKLVEMSQKDFKLLKKSHRGFISRKTTRRGQRTCQEFRQ